ncbi:MAG TPA: DHA2 family efflux MFS transporter permease subunit [Bauldia sp.]|nr:DHA2 family efflux MFS transporter permease subunit [Bauldia sp.]
MSGTGADGLPFKEVPHKGLITISVMAAMIMVILDMTIANVALPHMQASLGAAQDTITWVLTSYIVAQAIATPITGWLSDNIGRKRLFAICVAGFVGSSALCGTALGLEEMVLFRILQGAFGASLAPLSQSVIMDINPREKQGQAMALWGTGIMIAPIIGPTIGAYLTDNFNWRWVFYINVPVGLAALTGVILFMPDTVRRIRKFDFTGFAFLSIAVGALQLMLDRGAELDWFNSPEVLVELAVAIGSAWMFLIHTITHHEPFLDKRLFTDRNFTSSLVLIFVVGIVLLATMALLPPMLQNLFGYPIITVGLVLAPRGFGTMASMMVVGRLVGKVDPRLLVLFGLSLTALSLYWMTFFAIGMGSGPLIWSGVVQGFGLGFVFIPLSTVAFQTLDFRLRTEASALFNLVRNIGSAIGISIMAALLISNMQTSHADLASWINPFNPNLFAFGIDPNALTTQAGASTAAQLDGLITQQSLMIAYIDDFKLMFLITLASVPLLLLLRYKRPQAAPAGAPQRAPEPAVVMAD